MAHSNLSRQKPKKSGFSSFAAFDDEENEEDNDEATEEKEEEIVVTPTQKSKKKKKKNKKKKEDFDAVLAEHGFKGPDKPVVDDKSQNFSKAKSVLQIESKFLDADAELKRIFGAAAISGEAFSLRIDISTSV